MTEDQSSRAAPAGSPSSTDSGSPAAQQSPAGATYRSEFFILHQRYDPLTNEALAWEAVPISEAELKQAFGFDVAGTFRLPIGQRHAAMVQPAPGDLTQLAEQIAPRVH